MTNLPIPSKSLQEEIVCIIFLNLANCLVTFLHALLIICKCFNSNIRLIMPYDFSIMETFN